MDFFLWLLLFLLFAFVDSSSSTFTYALTSLAEWIEIPFLLQHSAPFCGSAELTPCPHATLWEFYFCGEVGPMDIGTSCVRQRQGWRVFQEEFGWTALIAIVCTPLMAICTAFYFLLRTCFHPTRRPRRRLSRCGLILITVVGFIFGIAMTALHLAYSLHDSYPLFISNRHRSNRNIPETDQCYIYNEAVSGLPRCLEHSANYTPESILHSAHVQVSPCHPDPSLFWHNTNMEYSAPCQLAPELTCTFNEQNYCLTSAKSGLKPSSMCPEWNYTGQTFHVRKAERCLQLVSRTTAALATCQDDEPLQEWKVDCTPIANLQFY